MDEINYEILKITDAEANSVKIANSADRPNAFNSYRQSKKTAADVKKMFDAPFELAMEKHNALVDQMEANDVSVAERLDEQDERMIERETMVAEKLCNQNTRIAAAEGVVAQLREEADSGAFKGEKGDKGDQGEQGVQGEKGEKGDAGVVEFIIVTELPTENIKNAIYLVPSTDTESGNAFDEYIYVNGVWEKIGNASVAIDLDEFAKKVYVDEKMSEIQEANEKYVDDTVGDISAALDRIIAIQNELMGIVETITFTVIGIYNENINFTLTAERGMTWGEWIESEYNTIGAYPSGNNSDNGSVYFPSEDFEFTVVHDKYGVDGIYDAALTTEVIIDGYAYEAVEY